MSLHAQESMAGGLPHGKASGRGPKVHSANTDNLMNDGSAPSEKQAPKRRPAETAHIGGAVRKR